MWWMFAWIVPCLIGYLILSAIRRWVRIDNIPSKYILITGCDSGLGNLLAQRLDMMGCHVFAGCLSESAKTRLQVVTSRRLKGFVMDVANEDQIKQAVEFVRAELPGDTGLWGLVNNAGILGHVAGPLEWHSSADFQQVMEVNALGVVKVTMAFLPLLKQGHGRLVNMSCMLGRVPFPLAIPYCMSKAAVEMFSDCARQHLSQYDVSVHVIEPGMFKTDMFSNLRIRKLFQQGWKGASLKVKADFGENYVTEAIQTVQEWCQRTSSENVGRLLKAYTHALTARCPRTRYTVGWGAQFLYLPLSYSPSVVQDYCVSKILSKVVPTSLRAE